MLGLSSEAGYQITHSADDAEIIVVNTCGFIEDAKQESIDTILEAAQYKDKKCQKLIVAGCLSERYPEQLKKEIPEIDVLCGTQAFSEITKFFPAENKSSIEKTNTRLKDYDLPRINTQAFFRAYLKLAEGCAKRCSFCVIPSIRGPLRSRNQSSLVKEAMTLAQGGVKELSLIAQDLTDYGRDRKDESSLQGLLQNLQQIKGLDWIRLFYMYPDQLEDKMLHFIADNPKICRYLDLPLQHINNQILSNMNRKIDSKKIYNMIEKLKSHMPDIVLRTSLMVGFPGETEENFKELCDFVEQGHIDHLGVFTYSHEEGSPSYKKFEDNISLDTKLARQKELLALQSAQLSKNFASRWQDKKVSVLIEDKVKENLYFGRHYGQAHEVDNKCLIESDKELTLGEFVDGSIDSLKDADHVVSLY